MNNPCIECPRSSWKKGVGQSWSSEKATVTGDRSCPRGGSSDPEDVWVKVDGEMVCPIKTDGGYSQNKIALAKEGRTC